MREVTKGKLEKSRFYAAFKVSQLPITIKIEETEAKQIGNVFSDNHSRIKRINLFLIYVYNFYRMITIPKKEQQLFESFNRMKAPRHKNSNAKIIEIALELYFKASL